MDKITYDKLSEFGDVMSCMFRLMYPLGLSMEELEEKAKQYNWLKLIYERFKEE